MSLYRAQRKLWKIYYIIINFHKGTVTEIESPNQSRLDKPMLSRI